MFQFRRLQTDIQKDKLYISVEHQQLKKKTIEKINQAPIKDGAY